MKKITQLVAIVALLGLSVPSAFAANTNVNVTVTGSNFSITAPASVNMSAVNLDTILDSGATSTGTLTGVGIKDNRATSAGWNVTVQVSNFVGVTPTNIIPVTNLSVAPANLANVGNSSLTGVSLASARALTGTTDNMSVVSATNGNGRGRYSLDIGLNLFVDVATAPDAYTATVVATII